MTDLSGGATPELGFDPEALHRKYLAERNKRLRADGDAQYLDLSGDFAAYADDVYADPGLVRDPLSDEVDVVVVGGGHSGLLTAARMREAGVPRIRVIEKGADFGGTWYWNRYPGIRCDVESYIYMPLLEELGVVPSEKYARGDEIFAHARAIGNYYNLYSDACFQTQVTDLRWDESSLKWIVRTDRGDQIKAQFVCLCTGPLSRPKLPGIPGIKDFGGRSFHTSRWDFSYTGGDTHGNLTGLAGKRVAVIGTGASAIQVIPHIAESAAELLVFQRTPSSVDVRGNKPTDPGWVRSLEPGWQRRRIANFDSIMLGIPQEEDLVADRWTDVWAKLTVWANNSDKAATEGDPSALMQLADYQKMEEIRARVDEIVKDPRVAESLKPYYNQFCKRPLYSDDFLQTFNRPNVTLVDTEGAGIERITETGIDFGGKSYDVDGIIFATGFKVGAPPYESGAFDVVGRGGDDCTLAKRWSDGVKSLHGIYMNGFPNLFIVGGIAQAAVTINFTHILAEQAKHIAAVVRRCRFEGVEVMEIREEAEQGWTKTMAEKVVDRSKFERECTPGYYNNEGKVDDSDPTLFGRTYGGGPFEYVQVCADWLESRFTLDAEITRAVDRRHEQEG